MRKKIDRVLEWILCTILVVMVADVVWQVLSRYAFHRPSIYTDEFASFSLIWLGILGGAYVYGCKEHLAIDFLVNKLSEPTQRLINILIEVVILLFAIGVLIAGGMWLVYTRFLLSIESAAMGVNWGYVYLSLPISGALISFYSIDNLLNLRKKIA